MLQNISKILSFSIVIFFLSACGNTKKITDDGDRIKLPKVKEELLIERLNWLSEQQPESFYARINTKYSSNTDNLSFVTTARMKLDSALQVTISYAKIPMFNAMITPDSLTLVDRRSKCYIHEGVDFFKHQFNVDFNHRNIEELLLGIPIDWQKEKEYHQVKDAYNYIVVPEINKVNSRSNPYQKDFLIQYYLNDNVETLQKIIIESPKDTTLIEVNYSDYAIVNDFNIPHNIKVNIKNPRNDIFVDLKYTKTEINESNVLYLAIPDKYEECE